jgi:hypothetical protein
MATDYIGKLHICHATPQRKVVGAGGGHLEGCGELRCARAERVPVAVPDVVDLRTACASVCCQQRLASVSTGMHAILAPDSGDRSTCMRS